MEPFLWMFLPVFVAGGSALLSYYVMQAKMDVAIAKERESLAEARATIDAHKITLEQRVKAVEETTRRTTMDEMMREFHIEERNYMRDTTDGKTSKKLMVMQERMFFRNIPLSNWTEREMVVEEETHLPALGQRQVPAVLFPLPMETPQGRIAISKQIAGQRDDNVADEGKAGPFAMHNPQSLAALHQATQQHASTNGLQPKGLQVVQPKQPATKQNSPAPFAVRHQPVRPNGLGLTAAASKPVATPAKAPDLEPEEEPAAAAAFGAQ